NFVPLKACVRTSNIPKQSHTDDIKVILNLENGSVYSNDSGVGVSAFNNTRSLCNVKCCKCAVSSPKAGLVPVCPVQPFKHIFATDCEYSALNYFGILFQINDSAFEQQES